MTALQKKLQGFIHVEFRGKTKGSNHAFNMHANIPLLKEESDDVHACYMPMVLSIEAIQQFKGMEYSNWAHENRRAVTKAGCSESM